MKTEQIKTDRGRRTAPVPHPPRPAKYPDGLCDWNLQPFPTDLKDKMIGVAKFKGLTTPQLVESILVQWLEDNVQIKDEKSNETP